MVVDDADVENDLRTGTEKRVQAAAKKSEDFKLSSKTKAVSIDKAPTKKDPKYLEKKINSDPQILSKVRKSSNSSLTNQIDDTESKIKSSGLLQKLNEIDSKSSTIDTNDDDDFDMLLKSKSKELQNKKQGDAPR